ncbi:DUF1189 family protein [candidate division KSB1 bacterium]|nr:DUF1189 family protein [candidate division KSB1 bacterium]
MHVWLGKIASLYYRHKGFGYLLIAVLALLWHLHSIAPLLTHIQDRLMLYSDALHDTMPAMTLADESLTFQGDLPKQIIMPDGVEFWFTHDPDSNLIKSSKKFSSVISDTVLFYKGKSRVHRVGFKDISLDSVHTIDGEWLTQKVHTIRWKVIPSLLIISTVLIFLLLLILAYFCAGIALLGDAFNNGPLSFTQLFQTSVLLLIGVSIVMWCLMELSIRFTNIVIPAVLFTVLGMFVGTLAYIKRYYK